MIKEMRVILFAAAVMLLAVSVANAQVVVVDFDDLDYDYTLSGMTYAGLTWEWGNDRGDGHLGEWYVMGNLDSYPYSEPHCVTNGWGAAFMGIGFPETVTVQGAYFSGMNSTLTSPGVRVHGYLDGSEVAVTNWFEDIDTTPDWFAINLSNVDRIVIESIPVERQGLPDVSWYQMDNFTYVPEPATITLLALGGLLLRRRK